MTNCLEEVTRVFVFSLFILIDSCVNFAKWIDLNHTHKEKVILEKAWNIISRSGTEINILAVPTQKQGNHLVFKFPNSCELLVTQDFMEYLMT